MLKKINFSISFTKPIPNLLDFPGQSHQNMTVINILISFNIHIPFSNKQRTFQANVQKKSIHSSSVACIVINNMTILCAS